MATEIPSSVQTSQTVEDLTKALRRMDLETEAKTALLALQLKAEQEKSRTLERMLQEKEDVQELQERVKTAEETEMRLRTELVKMTRRSVLITEDERLQARGKELETENFLLSQKVKSLEKQIKDVKSSAVISIQLALVREKETSLLDFSSKCELLTSENSSLQKSTEELKKLRDEAQKQMFEIQTNFEINEKNAKEAAKRANEEISELKEKTRKLISENREKDEEIIALQAKISEIRSYKGQIFDDVKELEANLSSLQDTIQTLRKQIGEKNKAIETLEYELNCLKQEGRDVAGLMENKRKNGEVISDLREKSRKLDEEMMTLSMNLVNSRQENQTLIAKIASMERDRATLLELNEELRSKLVEAEAELKYTDERVKQVRENTKEEMMSRIIALKQEKVELESKLDELQDTIDMQKKSFFEAPSLMDELKQLEDVGGYRRMSILPGSNPAQEKQIESLKLELVRNDIERKRVPTPDISSRNRIFTSRKRKFSLEINAKW